MTCATPPRAVSTMLAALVIGPSACGEDETDEPESKTDRQPQSQAEKAAADSKPCGPVPDLFPNTNDATDLLKIQAQGISCQKAKQLAKKGTETSLSAGAGVSKTKILRYREWWLIVDVSGPKDHYQMLAAWPKRITWMSGEL